jgi:hypothetical protein
MRRFGCRYFTELFYRLINLINFNRGLFGLLKPICWLRMSFKIEAHNVELAALLPACRGLAQQYTAKAFAELCLELS